MPSKGIDKGSFGYDVEPPKKEKAKLGQQPKQLSDSERKLEEQRKAQFVCRLCSKQAIIICPHCNIQFCNYHSMPSNHNCTYLPVSVKQRNLDEELGL